MEQAGGLKNRMVREGRFAIAHGGRRFLWGKVDFVAALDGGRLQIAPP